MCCLPGYKAPILSLWKSSLRQKSCIPALQSQHTSETLELSHQESRHLGHSAEVLVSLSSVCYPCIFYHARNEQVRVLLRVELGPQEHLLRSIRVRTVIGPRESVWFWIHWTRSVKQMSGAIVPRPGRCPAPVLRRQDTGGSLFTWLALYTVLICCINHG